MKNIAFAIVVLFSFLMPFQVIEASALKNLKLIFEDRTFTLNFKTNPQLVQKSIRHFIPFGNKKIIVDLEQNLIKNDEKLIPIQSDFIYTINPQALELYFSKLGLSKPGNRRPVKIYTNKNNQIVINGGPQSGRFQVDIPRLVKLINVALLNEETYIKVPSKKVYNPVDASPDLADRGIKEILGIGTSNFTGSSHSRIQNIIAGAKKFNGIIIPKGKIFSFNRTLKSVNEDEGFVKELIIKGNDPVKELGGGVCQVSTTVFRSAFKAGLPIVNRRNHSYAVPYYAPHGLDATIYLGGQDFRFKNDTPGDILVQSFVDNEDLFFVLYGTKDDREINFEGPFISHYQVAPEDQIYETPELPEGELVELSEAHDGFRSEWIRRIRKGKILIEEPFVSHYRPWPAKILRGTGIKEEAIAFDPSEPKKDIKKTKQRLKNNIFNNPKFLEQIYKKVSS